MAEMMPAPGAPPAEPGIASAPVTQPTQNRGLEAQGLAQLKVVVNMLAQILPMVGASGDAGQAINRAIGQLAKFVPPGAVSPAAESNQLDTLQRRAMQAGPQVAALRGQAA